MQNLRRSYILCARALVLLLLIIAVQSLIDIWSYPFKSEPGELVGASETAKVFIASIHWNNEAILRSHWIDAIAKLTESFGAANVFVSVYGSGSWDWTKDALRLLDQMLDTSNVSLSIALDDTTHRDELARSPGETRWISTSQGKQELRRIPYLARLRNLVLKPLEALAQQGRYFDRILFLNDVVFTVQNVKRLLNIREGNYAAACALDFAKSPNFYDILALRDLDGHDALVQTWPFFRSRGSRRALKANQPTPVQSCWNGIGTPYFISVLNETNDFQLLCMDT